MRWQRLWKSDSYRERERERQRDRERGWKYLCGISNR